MDDWRRQMMARILGGPSLADQYVNGAPVGRESLDEPTMSMPSPDVIPAGRSMIDGRPIDPRLAALQQQNARDAVNHALGFAGSTNLSIPRVAAPIRAYHGSPHNFPAERLVQMRDGSTQWITGKPDVLPDIPNGAKVIQDFPLGRFRMDKIGTGEGNQAYGHGAYAAENEAVGQGYKTALALKNRQTVFDGVPLSSPRDYWSVADKLKSVDWRHQKAFEQLNSQMNQGLSLEESVKYLENWNRNDPKLVDAVKSVAGRMGVTIPKGHMYELNLHVDPKRLLDWDKPLSAQPHKNILSRLGKKIADEYDNSGFGPTLTPDGTTTYRALDDAEFGGQWIEAAGRAIRGNPTRQVGPKDAAIVSNILKDAGIQGIRYLDGGSRAAGAGSSNYVIFDPLTIEILRKYGLLPPLVGGGAAALAGATNEPAQQ